MDGVFASGSSPADPGSGANAGAAASAAPAAPAAPDADDVVEVSRAKLEARLKETLRVEKLLRLKNQQRKSKPSGASAYHWTYLECYVQAHFHMYAICKLCWEQQEELDRAEIKYSQSPTNLLRHLNTEFPGHRDAFDACTRHKTGKSSPSAAAASGSKASPTGIESYFDKDTTGWHQHLVRWMVMNAIPFSVRYSCAFLSNCVCSVLHFLYTYIDAS